VTVPFVLKCAGCGSEDPEQFSIRRPAIQYFPVWGVVRGRLAVGDESETIDTPEGVTELYCSCGKATPIAADMRWYEFRGHNTFAKAVAMEAAGDTHVTCFCTEDDLLSKHGVSFQIVYSGDDRMCSPTLRGWFTADVRLVRICPICEGSLLRKVSDMIREGAAVAETLAKVKL